MYPLLYDYDDRNGFDVGKYRKRKMKVKEDEVFEVYEVGEIAQANTAETDGAEGDPVIQ